MTSSSFLILLGACLGTLYGFSMGVWGAMTGALVNSGLCAAGIAIHDAAERYALKSKAC